MKRSEFLTEVEGKLVDELCYSFTREQIADILKVFEDAGMAPPGETHYYQHGSGDDYFCTTYDVHKWEPEDD